MTVRFLLLVLTVSLFLSCSRNLNPTGTSQNLVIYPPPPDTTRVQFLLKISNSGDVTRKRGGFKRFILGAEAIKTIGKPYGVTMYKGKIYICDTFKHGFDIIDLEKSTFTEFIPSGKGELKTPLNCSIDQLGNLYVADAERKQVVIFNDKGDYISSFGEKEDFKPTDIAVSDGKLWVLNMTGHQVMVYNNDSTYKLISRFPGVNTDSAGYLFSPTNLSVTENQVYVTDFGDFIVKKFSKDGKYLGPIGTYGDRPGQFTRPKGTSVDRESNLYVVDAGFENVQIFDKNDKLLMFFGGNYKGPGDMWLPAKVTLDYDNLKYFQKYVDPDFNLKYLILVTNQFGPDKLNIYGAVEPLTPEQKALKLKNKQK